MDLALPLAPLAPVRLGGELFAELDRHLLDLLRGLDSADWDRPTLCAEWTVKDVAAHLLDGTLRRVSAQRDGHRGRHQPAGFASYRELVAWIGELNGRWVRAADRLSPRVLIGLLAATGPWFTALMDGLDPEEPAFYPVAWAGEAASATWFDVAREYTEKWTHQRQIREAVSRPGVLETPPLYSPVLATFVRALPVSYRDVTAAQGARVRLVVPGAAGGAWDVVRHAGAWHLGRAAAGAAPAATVTVPPESAWLLFTHRRDTAARRACLATVTIEGDEHLGRPALGTVSVMA
ncbi:MAG TPA: maleylpyruvate isomerase family mycothiol-dependent enzyme [Thermoanaerobaculia bacterium]|nr:maleylpyruvate isomerase family mycothiol-dependent enzyme [Thermoanaerobaculia bacterium]